MSSAHFERNLIASVRSKVDEEKYNRTNVGLGGNCDTYRRRRKIQLIQTDKVTT